MHEKTPTPSPLRAALAQLAPQADDIIDEFYGRLLSERPDFAPHFAETDWKRQRRMLLNALVLAAEAGEEPEVVERTVRGYGRRHDSYALSAEDYEFFGRLLRETLQGHLNGGWTDEVGAAWDQAFQWLTATMRG